MGTPRSVGARPAGPGGDPGPGVSICSLKLWQEGSADSGRPARRVRTPGRDTSSTALPPCGRRPPSRAPRGALSLQRLAAESSEPGAAHATPAGTRLGAEPREPAGAGPGAGPGRGAPALITWVSNRQQPMGARVRWCVCSALAAGAGREWRHPCAPGPDRDAERLPKWVHLSCREPLAAEGRTKDRKIAESFKIGLSHSPDSK